MKHPRFGIFKKAIQQGFFTSEQLIAWVKYYQLITGIDLIHHDQRRHRYNLLFYLAAASFFLAIVIAVLVYKYGGNILYPCVVLGVTFVPLFILAEGCCTSATYAVQFYSWLRDIATALDPKLEPEVLIKQYKPKQVVEQLAEARLRELARAMICFEENPGEEALLDYRLYYQKRLELEDRFQRAFDTFKEARMAGIKEDEGYNRFFV